MPSAPIRLSLTARCSARRSRAPRREETYVSAGMDRPGATGRRCGISLLNSALVAILIANSTEAGRARRPRAAATVVALIWAVLGAACATVPANVENICAIFDEKSRWYKHASESEERWGTPVHVQMAIIHQESTFEFNARPPRRKLLGFIPWTRPSNAYGYAQALRSTWDAYREDTGRRFADRDDFADAIDFVGWYTDQAQAIAGISKWDPYNQYLAYHEGPTGWRRNSYRDKGWLVQTARRVEHRAEQWGAQLRRCQDDLDSGGWLFF